MATVGVKGLTLRISEGRTTVFIELYNLSQPCELAMADSSNH